MTVGVADDHGRGRIVSAGRVRSRPAAPEFPPGPSSPASVSPGTRTVAVAPVRRRSAAILYADAKGFSAAMERDEAGTWRRITRALSLFRELVPDYGGRIVDQPGDSVLALFASAVDALKFAIEVQGELGNEAVWGHGGRPLPFRIGINFGPVTEDGDRVYGHAINLAERIQRKASPGGICLSGAARDALGEELGPHLHPLGRPSLEGIDERVELFTVGEVPPGPVAVPPPPPREPVPPAGGASVAVLPFAAAAADAADGHLCAGVTADVIGALTRFRDLLVIAPHSAFLFGGSGLRDDEIADRLGVRYLVTGELRRAGARLRLRVRLAEARGGRVLWSERYDGAMDDVFAFEDEVAGTVAAQLNIRVSDAERRRLARLATPALDAYGMVLRGQALVRRYRREATLHARRLFERAAEADPGYGRPHAGASRTFNLAWRYGWDRDPAACLDRAVGLALRAVERDGLDARGHAELGFAHLYRKEHAASLAAYERAAELNPNDADVLAEYGDALVYDDQPGRALELLRRAVRLNPCCPDRYLWHLADAYLTLERPEEVVATVRRMRDPSQGRRMLAASYAHLGMLEEAGAEARAILELQPGFTVAEWARRPPYRNPARLEYFLEGLRRAGLPER